MHSLTTIRQVLINYVHDLRFKAILGYSCICPAFSTLILNLFSAIRVQEEELRWRSEYSFGAGHEVYDLKLPRVFAGKTFSQVAQVPEAILNILKNCRFYSLTIMYFFSVYLLNTLILNPKYVNIAWYFSHIQVVLNLGNVYTFTGNEVCFAFAQDKDEIDNLSTFYQSEDNLVAISSREASDMSPFALATSSLKQNPKSHSTTFAEALCSSSLLSKLSVDDIKKAAVYSVCIYIVYSYFS